MKYDSYPFLISTIVGAVVLIFGFVTWRVEIYQFTFLKAEIWPYIFLGAMAIALLMMPMFLIYHWPKRVPLSNYAILFVALTLCGIPVSVFVFITVTWLLPGEEVAWHSRYDYASGSRRSCSGADLYEPYLHCNIRICRPSGDYASNNILYIEKRQNSLGIVVTQAVSSP
jgi:hypothetical protein